MSTGGAIVSLLLLFILLFVWALFHVEKRKMEAHKAAKLRDAATRP